MSTPERHGCVTAWIILMIIANSLSALIYLFASSFLLESTGMEISRTLSLLLGFVGLSNVIFAVMLLQWKKWGFYGFILTSILALAINLSVGLSIGQSLLGLVGIAVLFGVLQIKKGDNSAWSQLK